MRVFENRVPRKIFGPKTDKVAGKWRRPHNEEIYKLNCLPTLFRRPNQEECDAQAV
jgi:hypothetical protein